MPPYRTLPFTLSPTTFASIDAILHAADMPTTSDAFSGLIVTVFHIWKGSLNGKTTLCTKPYPLDGEPEGPALEVIDHLLKRITTSKGSPLLPDNCFMACLCGCPLSSSNNRFQSVNMWGLHHEVFHKTTWTCGDDNCDLKFSNFESMRTHCVLNRHKMSLVNTPVIVWEKDQNDGNGKQPFEVYSVGSAVVCGQGEGFKALFVDLKDVRKGQMKKKQEEEKAVGDAVSKAKRL